MKKIIVLLTTIFLIIMLVIGYFGSKANKEAKEYEKQSKQNEVSKDIQKGVEKVKEEDRKKKEGMISNGEKYSYEKEKETNKSNYDYATSDLSVADKNYIEHIPNKSNYFIDDAFLSTYAIPENYTENKLSAFAKYFSGTVSTRTMMGNFSIGFMNFRQDETIIIKSLLITGMDIDDIKIKLNKPIEINPYTSKDLDFDYQIKDADDIESIQNGTIQINIEGKKTKAKDKMYLEFPSY